MAKKTKIKHIGLQALGETNILAGILLIFLGSVIITLPNSDIVLRIAGSIIIFFGLILAGFGIGDYTSSK